MKRVLVYFLTACLISWLCWMPYFVPGFPVAWQTSSFLHYLGLTGPLLSALIGTWQQDAQPGLRKLFRSMLLPRGAFFYAVIVPLLPFLLLFLAASFATLGYFSSLDWRGLWRTRELGPVHPLAFIALNVGVVGLGEETGWRGYALPRLQQHFSAFSSSLILTVGWAIWHWPLFFYVNSGYHSMEIAGIVGWLMSLLTGSILFTWLFNSSRGSILSCALFHGFMDIAFMADLGKPEIANYVGMSVTIWGLSILFLYKFRHLSPWPRLRVV
ncbi:CPBP family intramembrane glutamic endopeptidase [Larkinella bovis]|uniref:CPBP family intramembrane glutamic endopeptidase n=1 Tax=Larkinella bovis TaxID=683041 RepID=A0ABW0IHX5_9BACT